MPIDHFAEVSLAGFYDLANALGGIKVCLNNAVNDSDYSGAVFPADVQTLNGAQSLAFVRQRHGLPNGDLDRTSSDSSGSGAAPPPPNTGPSGPAVQSNSNGGVPCVN